MQRWNGWGETERNFCLPLAALSNLEELLGASVHTPDADYQTSLDAVPTS